MENTPQTSLQATTQLAELLTTLAAGALEPTKVEGAWLVNVPNTHKQVDITDVIEKANPVRFRKRGTVRLGDVASLLIYCGDQGAVDTGYIYADPDSRTITAVFNDQRAGVAGWRDHRAVFKAELTPEFERWLNRDGKDFTQTEFAEFIEDNISDLAGDEAPTLLAVATTIQATTGINFSSAKRLQDGQTQLVYSETIDTKAGVDGQLKIPQTFALGLRIFKNGAGYKLTARLKYRLSSGGVKFRYELERPERAIDDAFNGYVDKVREVSGYTVLIGNASNGN